VILREGARAPGGERGVEIPNGCTEVGDAENTGVPAEQSVHVPAELPDRQAVKGWLVGCVAKTILSAKPNQPPISSVDYAAFNPRISRMN
jgi:hypothetical protein